MKLAFVLLPAISMAVLCHMAVAAPPSESMVVMDKAGHVSRIIANEENDFTADQMAQLRQLTRGKRSFPLNPFAILLKIVRKALGLPSDADPFIIVLALVARLLGLQDEFSVLATSIGLLSEPANPKLSPDQESLDPICLGTSCSVVRNNNFYVLMQPKSEQNEMLHELSLLHELMNFGNMSPEQVISR